VALPVPVDSEPPVSVLSLSRLTTLPKNLIARLPEQARLTDSSSGGLLTGVLFARRELWPEMQQSSTKLRTVDGEGRVCRLAVFAQAGAPSTYSGAETSAHYSLSGDEPGQGGWELGVGWCGDGG